MPEALTAFWSNLADEPASPSGVQRVRIDPDAAADVFACIFWPSGRPGFLVEGGCDYRPGPGGIPTCRGVRVIHEVVTVPEVRTLLRVVLEDEGLLDIFAVMSADLINAVVAEASAPSALRRCIDRLCMWHILFERVPAAGLTEPQQRGLLGELLVLERVLLPRMDGLAAVSAWTGPDASHQDFISSGLAIEVKTSLAKRPARMMISNEKQLDERPHETLILVHLRLDESRAHGDSLPAAVGRVRGLLATDAVASARFDDLTAMSGYLAVHAPLYQARRWLCSATRYYRVAEGFPRLTEANLPEGVGDIRYSISADDLGAYEVSFDDVATLVEASDV